MREIIRVFRNVASVNLECSTTNTLLKKKALTKQTNQDNLNTKKLLLQKAKANSFQRINYPQEIVVSEHGAFYAQMQNVDQYYISAEVN